MSAANQDVTVAVARAESNVLAAARALYDGVTPRQLASVTWVGPRAAIERLEALMDAANALAAADEAEAAEIAAHESEMQQRVADHEVWLAEAENAVDTRDWYAEYEADMVERACRERAGGPS